MKTTYKKYSKKVLSVFLSLLMVLTSVSVAFVFTASAAPSDDFNALAEALKSDTVKDLLSYADTSANKVDFTFDRYTDFEEVAKLMELLDAAVKSTSAYASRENKGQNSTHGTPETIKTELTNEMRSREVNVSGQDITTFFDAVFSMNGYVDHSKATSTQNNVSQNFSDVVTVAFIGGVKGYLANVESYEALDEEILLSVTWSLNATRRECYSTGSGCNATSYYDHAISGITFTKTTDKGEAKSKIDAYKAYLATIEEYFSFSTEEFLAMTVDEINAAYEKYEAEYTAMVEYLGGEKVYDRIIGDLDIAKKLLNDLAEARELVVVNTVETFIADKPNYGEFNYGGFEYDAMVADYAEFSVYYAMVKTITDDYDAYYTNFTDNVKVYDLQDVHDKAEELYAQVKDTYESLTSAEQDAAFNTLLGYVYAISPFSDQVKAAIYPNGYDHLTDLAVKLYREINPAIVFFAQNSYASFVDTDKEVIKNLADQARANIGEFNNIYDALVAGVGEERAAALMGDLYDAANALEDKLMSELQSRFEAEIDVAYAVWENHGKPATISTLDLYVEFGVAFEAIEADIYDYLKANASGYITAETDAKYTELKNLYVSYEAVRASFGFAAYDQKHLHDEDGVFAIRDVYSNDKVKTEPYKVTEDLLNDTIVKLDTFLSGDTFAELVGLEGGIGEAVKGLLADALFTDDMINTLVQFLYPTIYDYLGDFLGSISFLSGIIYSTLNNDLDVSLTPNYLGNRAEMKNYTAAATALKNASSDWKSSRIYDAEEDKLTLTWGLDAYADASFEEKAEAFYDAASAALSGLNVLLRVLLCDHSFSKTVILFVNISAKGGHGYANALVPIFEMLGLEKWNGVNGAGTNGGYRTADQMVNIGKSTDVDPILRAIFEPIFTFIDTLGDKPLDTVLQLLPNLVYALNFGMVQPILNELSAFLSAMGNDIDLSIGDMVPFDELLGFELSELNLPKLLSLLGVEIPAIDDATLMRLGNLTVKTGSERQNFIYDTTGLNSGEYYHIEADKADVAYFLLSYVVDLIQDEEAFANLISAFAGSDEEDPDADVEDPDADVEDTEDSNDILATITDVLGMLNIVDTGDAIAALVELLNAESYGDVEFTYENFAGTAGSPVAESEKICYTPYWTKHHAKYVSDNLVVLVQNILDLVGIFTNEDGTAFNAADALTGLLESLYTKETLEELVGLVGGLLDGLFNDEDSSMDVMSIINTVAPLVDTVDVVALLDHVQTYEVPDFEDGNRDAFVDALVGYVAPLAPVLKVLLVGGDNVLSLGGELITVYGANGYESGLIPVLEAIGCDPADFVSYDDLAAITDNEALVKAILKPVLGLVDRVLGAEDAETLLNNVIGLIPNILYFIENDGLNQAIENLLRPIYAVLDELRPIINVDLTLNLNLPEMITDLLASVDIGIVLPSYAELSALLMSIGTVEEYTSATGATAKKLTVETAFTPEFITSLLRTVVRTLLYAGNDKTFVEWINNNECIPENVKADLANLIDAVANLPADQVLLVLFYMFFGINTGVQGAVDLRDAGAEGVRKALEKIGFSTSEEFSDYVSRIAELLKSLLNGGEKDPEGTANAFTSFIQQIVDFFNNIFNAIRRVLGLNG